MFVSVFVLVFIFMPIVMVAFLENPLCCAESSACVWVSSENQMKVMTPDQQMQIVQWGNWKPKEKYENGPKSR